MKNYNHYLLILIGISIRRVISVKTVVQLAFLKAMRLIMEMEVLEEEVPLKHHLWRYLGQQ